jgi:ferredoxin/flavodoxin---NADP+ reductase
VEHKHDVDDCLIIGGGPVGLFAAFYAGLRHMRTKIIDSLDELGGQLATLYPEKLVFDVAGFPKVLARDLARNLIEQAMQYNPTVCLGETSLHLERIESQGCYCVTSDKAKHYAKTIIICAGAGAFKPKKLTIHGAEKFEGKGLHYSVKSKAVFKDQRVLIIGGGDSAVDWALNLQDTASHITLIHRRNQFRAHEDSMNKIKASGTQIMPFWEIKGIGAEDGTLDSAVLFNNQDKEERTLPVDSIIVQIGFSSDLGAIKSWPIEVIRSGIVVDGHMQTKLPGVFSAGDVAHYDGKLKLIVTGFGEAATAVNFAKMVVDPKAKFFPGHSSEMSPQENIVSV